MKASISFSPNLAKKNALTCLIPIYLRVCLRRNKAECRLNAMIHENDLPMWDPVTQRVRERNSAINVYLSSIEKKFNDLILLQPELLPLQSAATLRDKILGVDRTPKAFLLDYIDKYFQGAVMNNVNVSAGTIKNYRKAINHLKAFVTFNHLNNVLLESIDFEFACNFKNYLVSSNSQTGRIGMNEVSAAGIIKKMRTIFSHAMESGIILNNPFKKVRIKTKSSARERLSMEQVATLFTIDLSHTPHLEIYRDLFLFSVFTGLAYQDAINLTESNLEYRTDGECKLTITRHKTGVVTESFLTAQAKQLINKYDQSADRKVNKRVLPQRSNQNVNKHLKQLTQMLGIPFLLTTHIARHTFRQLLAEAGITDMAIIKRMMGQTRSGDIDAVYYQVTEKGLLKAKQKFEILFNQYF